MICLVCLSVCLSVCLLCSNEGPKLRLAAWLSVLSVWSVRESASHPRTWNQGSRQQTVRPDWPHYK